MLLKKILLIIIYKHELEEMYVTMLIFKNNIL